eukprot:scaffold21991_cov37-Phaeocystis_antarctica.AAC.1
MATQHRALVGRGEALPAGQHRHGIVRDANRSGAPVKELTRRACPAFARNPQAWHPPASVTPSFWVRGLGIAAAGRSAASRAAGAILCSRLLRGSRNRTNRLVAAR